MRVRSIWQTITFQQQETAEIKNRIRAAWASFYRYKQELTSRSCFLPHRLRLLNMVITPTMSHASGNWTLSKEHERMIRSTQRKVLRLIVQTKRKYKKKTQPSKNGEDAEDKHANHRSSDEETAEGSNTNRDCDQDSDISFTRDTDEEIEKIELTASTAVERMKAAKIPCWIGTHRRMKWRLAMRIARKQQNGTHASATCTRQTDQWEDQKRDVKMKYMTSSSQMKLKRRKATQ